MSATPRQGPVKSHLEQLIGRHSRESGVATDRVRRWVSTMALLGSLERASPDRASPLFLLKGGVAIELRVHTGARATKDVDVVFGRNPANCSTRSTPPSPSRTGTSRFVAARRPSTARTRRALTCG